MFVRIAVIVFFLAACSRSEGTQRLPATGSAPVPSGEIEWMTARPDSLGMNIAALGAHQLLCERTGADSCLVVYRGRIVQEWYSPRIQVPMYAMSTTKSITAILVGMLIDDGRIKSVDERVCTYIATWCSGLRGKVTLRHLLSMTSGLPMMPRDSSVGYTSGDKNDYVTRLTPTSEPGTTWAYSNEGAQLLSPILDKAAGEPIQDYARRRLFEPLGLKTTRLHVYPNTAWTYADMETTTRELARIGMLVLNGGEWEGKRIVSKEWLSIVTQPSQTINRGYGYLWYAEPKIGLYAMRGHLDTQVNIIPDLDLLVVRMQSKDFPGVSEGEYERQALPTYRSFAGKR